MIPTQKVLLGNDLVINENDCNLSCEYCLTGQSNLKKSHEEQLIFKPPKRDLYKKDSPLGERLNSIVGRIKQDFKTPFIKITGGEIYLVKGIMDFIEECSNNHIIVVVQTNGTLVTDEAIERLKKIKNLVIQVSLDSHLHQGNSYRIDKKATHEAVVKRIEKILCSGMETEVYAVLNNRSVEEMELFATWLLDIKAKTVYCPFPIRGPNSDAFKVKADQVHHIEKFVEKYDQYASILPPMAYFKRLLSFCREGERKFRCHVPRLVLSTFSDGVLTACPNIWFSELGNVFDTNEEWKHAKEKVFTNGLYQALLSKTPRLKACKGCFTPWDTLSMYFDNEITLDELCKSPTYAHPLIRELILKKKQEYLCEENGKVCA